MTEIKKIVEWYRDLPRGYNDINELMHKRQRLSGYFYTLTEEMGLAKKIHLASETILERKKTRIRVMHQSSGVGRADNLSRFNTSDEHREVQEAQGEFSSLFYLYKSTAEVISTMSQHIAYLREELSKSKI